MGARRHAEGTTTHILSTAICFGVGGKRPDSSSFVFRSGENWAEDRQGAPTASRRGAWQVPQQQVTTKHQVNASRDVSDGCFYCRLMFFFGFYLCSYIGLN